MSTSWAKKRVFQGNIANMEQKCHVISLFWLEMTIFQTSEGCSGPKNDYFGKKCAFWAQKGSSLKFKAIHQYPLRVQGFQKIFQDHMSSILLFRLIKMEVLIQCKRIKSKVMTWEALSLPLRVFSGSKFLVTKPRSRCIRCHRTISFVKTNQDFPSPENGRFQQKLVVDCNKSAQRRLFSY